VRRSKQFQQWRSHCGVGLFVFVLLFIIVTAFSQDLLEEDAQSKLSQGIDSFYMAKFESSVRLLREALLEGTLNKSDQFDAYVYIGFSLLRQGKDPSLVEKSFLEALNADPTKSLDRFKIPPDLLVRFESVKANTLGGLKVVSVPLEASVLLVNSDYNVELLETTPVVFNNLLVGEYDLLVSKNTYRNEIFTVVIRPDAIDTLVVQLAKKPKPIYKRWWAWSGGIALATALVIASSNGGEGEPPEGPDLPTPPERP
jgi:hypothetical protein